MHVHAAAETLIGPETYSVTKLPEGIHAVEVAKAYQIKEAL
jgi:hypothetical protein